MLLDAARFPRAKPCGESLNPGAVAALRRLGVSPPPETEAPRIHGWRLHGGTASITGLFPAPHSGLAWDRHSLDARLAEAAAAAGADLRTGVRVESVCRDVGGRPCGLLVRTAGGRAEVLRAPIVVGADGLRSAVARSLGLALRPPHERRKAALTAHLEGVGGLSGLIEMFAAPGLVVGVAPLGPDRANVTVVVPASAAGQASGRKAAFLLETASRFPELAERLTSARPASGVLACGPFERPVRAAAVPGALLVGDAAGYYDPLTGQGIYRALRSAELAADAVMEALGGGGDRAFVRYSARHRKAFSPGTALQRLIAWSTGHPALFDAALRLLGASPPLLAGLVRFVGDCPRDTGEEPAKETKTRLSRPAAAGAGETEQEEWTEEGSESALWRPET
ncbi:hypothetical protein J31TS4_16750 [Paenibacillus sp. J31TS4]|nr:hypothetical protein J31TS4_16750 [Paenibacillus sp. J31TS4]